jgi:hypothetical protein
MTPSRGAGRSARYRLRPGAFKPRTFRQDQWITLAQFDAVGAHSLGIAGPGFALFDGTRAVGTLQPSAQPSTQSLDRLGQTDVSSSPTQARKPTLGGGSRQQYRCSRIFGGGQSSTQPCSRGHSTSLRCCFVCTGSAPRLPYPRPSSQSWPPLSHPQNSVRGCHHPLAVPYIGGLVWSSPPYRRVGLSNGSVVSHGTASAPYRWVLVQDPLGKLDPQAFLFTDLEATPAQCLLWFRQRWQVEVTFQEVRAHLGVETQRKSADTAILCTTPALLALFSLVVLLIQRLYLRCSFPLPQTAWDSKQCPTFADALAFGRRYLWASRLFQTSRDYLEYVKVPRPIFDTWMELLCHAA